MLTFKSVLSGDTDRNNCKGKKKGWEKGKFMNGKKKKMQRMTNIDIDRKYKLWYYVKTLIWLHSKHLRQTQMLTENRESHL